MGTVGERCIQGLFDRLIHLEHELDTLAEIMPQYADQDLCPHCLLERAANIVLRAAHTLNDPEPVL